MSASFESAFVAAAATLVPVTLAVPLATPVVTLTGRSVVAQAVMEAAEDPSVLLGGLAALGVRDDVVDLAPGGGDLAEGMGTCLVPDLDGPPGGPGEEPGRLGALDPGPG